MRSPLSHPRAGIADGFRQGTRPPCPGGCGPTCAVSLGRSIEGDNSGGDIRARNNYNAPGAGLPREGRTGAGRVWKTCRANQNQRQLAPEPARSLSRDLTQTFFCGLKPCLGLNSSSCTHPQFFMDLEFLEETIQGSW